MTYPYLLSAFLLPAKQISRRYAESPGGTGIRSTGSFVFHFVINAQIPSPMMEMTKIITTSLPNRNLCRLSCDSLSGELPRFSQHPRAFSMPHTISNKCPIGFHRRLFVRIRYLSARLYGCGPRCEVANAVLKKGGVFVFLLPRAAREGLSARTAPY